MEALSRLPQHPASLHRLFLTFLSFLTCTYQIHYTERVNAELHDLLDKYEAEYFQSQASHIPRVLHSRWTCIRVQNHERPPPLAPPGANGLPFAL